MTGVSIGNHSLEIVDGNTCKIIKTFNINPPTYPSVSLSWMRGHFADNQTFNIICKRIGKWTKPDWQCGMFVNGELYHKGDCFQTNFTYQQGGVYSHQVVIFLQRLSDGEKILTSLSKKPQRFISQIFLLWIQGGENNGWKLYPMTQVWR